MEKLKQVKIETRPIKELPNNYMSAADRQAIIALLKQVQPETMAEFGCNMGHTTKVILDNVESIRRFKGIEVPFGTVLPMKAQRNEVPKEPGKLVGGNPKFQLIIKPHGTADLTAEELGPCDAILIDGDHSRAGVIRDTALARSVVKPGGIILWHDYKDDGSVEVKPVLEEMANAGALIFHAAGTWVAYERVPS